MIVYVYNALHLFSYLGALLPECCWLSAYRRYRCAIN